MWKSRHMSGIRTILVSLALSMVLSTDTCAAPRQTPPLFRPPAIPLVTHDPYFSIWSFSDRLTETETVHWTGSPHPLRSQIRVNDQTFRLLGTQPAQLPALPQTRVEIRPTRTVYHFEGAGVRVQLTFLTPALLHDLEVLSRPVTYITWSVQSVDNTRKRIQIAFDASGLLAVNEPGQQVEAGMERTARLTLLRAGSIEQPVLAKRGDDLRIDWGYLYVAMPTSEASSVSVISNESRGAFAATGRFPTATGTTRALASVDVALGVTFDLGTVNRRFVKRTVLIAYDDLFSIEYFRTRLVPYWRRTGKQAKDMLEEAFRDRSRVEIACERFDIELERDLVSLGGEAYRRLGVLAYRQTIAGNKLAADASGQPLLFPKENFSNGCISTVDVLYPMSPQILLFSPTLCKAMLIPVLDYAASPRWKWPFAPHDLGTYPKANGQVYGGGERSEENQMPVEESANMLIMVAALAHVEGNADFAQRYWPLLTRWAEYLKEKGYDPEHQLCTDDFAGHLARNVNLSAKAIVALTAYARMCQMLGKTAEAAQYSAVSREFAVQWVKEAADEGRTRLAFDKADTWSLKYNLIWDRILDLRLFPDDVMRREVTWYRRVQNRYGVPLDNRRDYTKLDWVLWSACLTGQRDDFDALVEPVALWLNETPTRVPLTDWYDTKTGHCVGFRARPVVGGVFIRFLLDQQMWRKWAMRDRTQAGPWAPFPTPVQLDHVVPAADTAAEPPVWRYTTDPPPAGWEKPEFDDSNWLEGQAGFGAAGTPGAIVRTPWLSPRIWLRRKFHLDSPSTADLRLWLHHDEDADIYLNGVLAASLRGYTAEYGDYEMRKEALEALRPGWNTLAVYCRQTVGGQYIDVGIVRASRTPR